MSADYSRVLLRLPNEGEVLDAAGTLILRVPATVTGGAYSVLELTLAPGQGAPMHVHHREDEIVHVLAGECEVADARGPRTALTGSLVVFPKRVVHGFRNVGSLPCRMSITAVPGGLEHFFIAINQAVAAGEATPERLAAFAREYEIDFLS